MLAQVHAQVLVSTNQVLGRTHATLAEALVEQKDIERAATHATAAVLCVRSAYGEASQVAVQEEERWLRLGLDIQQD
jgi:hypothetical protein